MYMEMMPVECMARAPHFNLSVDRVRGSGDSWAAVRYAQAIRRTIVVGDCRLQYGTLFGLLATTGVRVSEALNSCSSISSSESSRTRISGRCRCT